MTWRKKLYDELSVRSKPSAYWKARLRDKSDTNIERTKQELISGGEAAVPVLLELLKDPDDSYYRSCAAHCLGSIGPEAKKAIPDLAEALKDKDKYVRSSAAEALGRMGPDAKSTIAALRVNLQDDDPDVRVETALALLKLDFAGNPQAFDLLLETLKHENAYARSSALEAIAKLGPDAQQAVAPLTEALKDANPVVRLDAAVALWRVDRRTDVSVQLSVVE